MDQIYCGKHLGRNVFYEAGTEHDACVAEVKADSATDLGQARCDLGRHSVFPTHRVRVKFHGYNGWIR